MIETTLLNGKCSGCSLCSAICPRGAIEMIYDSEGFLKPRVDEHLCNKCGACLQKCPQMNYKDSSSCTPMHLYAAMADDLIRKNSSSGGVFYVISKSILEIDGVVFGAAFTEDYRSVHHVMIDRIEDLSVILQSKYIQSEIDKSIFLMVDEQLSNNKYVLFSGCPCQITALKNYLGKDYENLLTVDVLCNGVFSTSAYQKWLELISDGRDISKVSFRDKDVCGWVTNAKVWFTDGSVYSEGPKKEESIWKRGYLSNVANRICCSACTHKTINRVGDITLGDFWKAGKIQSNYDDKKGTSLVLINTKKGESFFERIIGELNNCFEVSLENEYIKIPDTSNGNEFRNLFFEVLESSNYEYALKKTVDSGKYNVGIVGYWWAVNYGSALTYYALYRTVEKLGYRVIMIDRPEKEKHPLGLDVFSRRFIEKNADTSASVPFGKELLYNCYAPVIIVGSDQVWAPGAIKDFDYFFFCDWVSESKKCVSYAASFGENFDVSESKKNRAAALLEKFTAISVREKNAVNICENELGLSNVKWVMDPVFLMDIDDWRKIASNSIKEINIKEKYILGYFLNPDNEKKRILEYVSEILNMSFINIVVGKKDDSNVKLFRNRVIDVDVEDFVKYYMNSSFVVTDSYHGTALSIIFNKAFIDCSTKKWGQDRHISLLSKLKLQSRQCLSLETIVEFGIVKKKIDWKSVNSIIYRNKIDSINWLMTSLAQ